MDPFNILFGAEYKVVKELKNARERLKMKNLIFQAISFVWYKSRIKVSMRKALKNFQDAKPNWQDKGFDPSDVVVLLESFEENVEDRKITREDMESFLSEAIDIAFNFEISHVIGSISECNMKIFEGGVAKVNSVAALSALLASERKNFEGKSFGEIENMIEKESEELERKFEETFAGTAKNTNNQEKDRPEKTFEEGFFPKKFN